MAYKIVETPEYLDWLDTQTKKSQVQIETRLSHIETDDHFGDHKHLEREVWELKWRSGRRIYYAIVPENNMLLLLGGNKNGQSKDIHQAHKIFERHVENET